ncbi:uncharacterized protein LOC126845316 [Adelges cooleyi]|uniref:uncharacterized protein LOC126845316 n=1 Tax=Adelges cooleyi TaxID=133065 RepID=UPI00217F96E8|nr:uncharacterized protein LOC126845316 [Adelges cooleyi]
MAGKDKHLDNWKLQSISSFEVQMYVGLFNKFDPWFDYSGLLNYDEVKNVVKALTLEEDVKKQLVDEIRKIFKVLMKDSAEDSLILTTSETMSAPYFLMAFLKVKPKGRGLNKHHVQELIHFHKNNKINGDQIDPVAISKFIKKLSLVQEEHEDVLVFDSRRKTPFQLQELLLVLAEYNKGASEENGPVYSTDSVRDILLHFSNYDVDKNGLLSKEELKKIQEPRYQIEDVDTTFKELDTEDDEHLYITEFFMAVFVERDRKNAIKD